MSEHGQQMDRSAGNASLDNPGTGDLHQLYDRNSSLFSPSEADSRLARGLVTQDMQVKHPERGLISSDLSFSGDASFQYDSNQRMDGLAQFTRNNVAGGMETNSRFENRTDGLVHDRVLRTLEVKEHEQTFEAGKNPDGKLRSHEIKTTDGSVDLTFNQYDPKFSENGLSHESTSREAGSVKTTKSFENHPQALVMETSEQTASGTRTVQNFADGRKNESFTLPNGVRVESKEYDKDGKLKVPDKPGGDKPNEPEDHEANYLNQFKTLLEQANFELSPLQKGWGPFQGLQAAAKERGLQFTNHQMRDEAIRIKNREFTENGRTSFKVGERLAFYSPKEIGQSVEQEKARYRATIV